MLPEYGRVMDRVEAMSVFLAVVEAGSLSAAARRLGMPLTTVSRKVADLEAHLKTRLLNRSSRHLLLTETGSAYLEACRKILDDISEAERVAAGEYAAPKGGLVITAPVVFGRLHVLPVVTAFLQTYPQITARLLLLDRIVSLHEERVDVAVRIGELPDSSLVATKVGEVTRVICASEAYFAARGVPQHPRELQDHDCITFEGLSSPTRWQFRDGKDATAVRVRSRLVVNTAEAAIDAAAAGLGLTRLLSYQVAGAVRAGTLRLALEAFVPLPLPVSLVHADQGRLPLKTRTFLDFAAPALRSRIAQG